MTASSPYPAVVVTGAASGIGAALAHRFAAAGSRVLVADLDRRGAARTAAWIDGLSAEVDVAVEDSVEELVRTAHETLGGVDVYCSNAGVPAAGGIDTPDEVWQRAWDINVMGHVYAARSLIRRRGPAHLRRPLRFVVTASAAGLLLNLGAVPYSATKRASIAVAEHLAVEYADLGMQTFCVCPQGVETPLLRSGLAGTSAAARAVEEAGRVIAPAEVADQVYDALDDDEFFILPHPEVADYWQARATGHGRWLAGMRRFHERVAAYRSPHDS